MSDINKYSILDIDGAADVVNNLLDKLGTAVGWGVNRETPERIAIATYIEDIKNSDYDSLLKAALISQAKKTIKEYCNQKDVRQLDKIYRLDHAVSKNTKSCAECIWKNF